MTDTNKKPLERIAERIESVSEELRVRLHLAGLDAKDAWDRAHLDGLTGELSRIGAEARLQMHLAGLDAKTAWDRIEQQMIGLKGRFGVDADHLVKDLAKNVDDALRAFRSPEGERSDRPERR